MRKVAIFSVGLCFAIAPAYSAKAPNYGAATWANHKFEVGRCGLLAGKSYVPKKTALSFAYIIPTLGAFSINPEDVRLFDPNKILKGASISQVLIDGNNEPGIAMRRGQQRESIIIAITTRVRLWDRGQKSVIVLDGIDSGAQNVGYSGGCIVTFVNDIGSVSQSLATMPKNVKLK